MIEQLSITGQVAQSLIGSDAFQEVDIYGMSLQVAKHNFLVRSAEELLTGIPEAFRLASSGRPRQWLILGGLITMGFGLPAAIGAALAEPGRPVVCVSGDGSLFMNLQKLATVAEKGLNLKLVLLNNGALGLVRQQQDLFCGGNRFAIDLGREEVAPRYPRLNRGGVVCSQSTRPPIHRRPPNPAVIVAETKSTQVLGCIVLFPKWKLRTPRVCS